MDQNLQPTDALRLEPKNACLVQVRYKGLCTRDCRNRVTIGAFPHIHTLVDASAKPEYDSGMKRLFAFVLSLLMLAGVFADAVPVNNDDRDKLRKTKA